MKIYERDYSKLTEQEIKDWEELKLKEIVNKNDTKLRIRKSLFRQYPKAVRHYLSLFPNNYLDIEELKDEKTILRLCDEFLVVLNDANTNERTVLNHVKDKNAYFIIASILKSNYNFGHHDAFIIPEFMLGNTYKVDYLLIGRNSGGYKFVFVELQNPYGKITISDGDLGDEFRKGIKQIDDWEVWLESNYSSLNETFQKYKHPEMLLDNEFCRLDKTRIHYVVVAGRRKDFNNKTYRIRRKFEESRKIVLLHYDNLYDSTKELFGKSTF